MDEDPKTFLPQTNVGDYILGYRSGYSAGYKDAMIALGQMKKEQRQKRTRNPHRTGEDYRNDIRKHLNQVPKLTATELFRLVGGTPANFQQSLKALMDMKIVRCEGGGVRGNPRIFELYPEARDRKIIRRTATGERIETIREGVSLAAMPESNMNGLSFTSSGTSPDNYKLMDVAKIR